MPPLQNRLKRVCYRTDYSDDGWHLLAWFRVKRPCIEWEEACPFGTHFVLAFWSALENWGWRASRGKAVPPHPDDDHGFGTRQHHRHPTQRGEHKWRRPTTETRPCTPPPARRSCNREFCSPRLVPTEAFHRNRQTPFEFLKRHLSGDWGDELCQEDRLLNDQALLDGSSPPVGLQVD